jgi:hypothetical protein
LLSVHYTHIKRPPNSRGVFRSGLADTTKMTAHSRATGLPDLAGDLLIVVYLPVLARVGRYSELPTGNYDNYETLL